MKRANEDSVDDLEQQQAVQSDQNILNGTLNGDAHDDAKEENEDKKQDPDENSAKVESSNPAKRKCRSADDEEIRLLVPSKLAGGIIGKAGANIQKLRNDSNARVQIADSRGSPDRVLTVNADLESCSNVIRALLSHLEMDSSNEYDLRFLIHQSLAGCVIGKSGATIKELRDDFGCNVKIFPDRAPFSTDRVVQIIGTEDQCIKAFLEIFGKLIKGQVIKGQVIDYNADNFDLNLYQSYGGYLAEVRNVPRNNDNRLNGHQKGNARYNRSRVFTGYVNPWSQPLRVGFSQNSTQGVPASSPQYATEKRVTSQVSIKNDMVGALIGRRGETINKIRAQSNASIHIDDSKRGSSMERIISITGTPNQIQMAQYMLQQCIRKQCDSNR